MAALEPEQEKLKRTLESMMDGKIPEQLDERMEKALLTFRENLPNHPCIQSQQHKNSWWTVLFGTQRWNLAWQAGFLFIAFVTAYTFLLGYTNPSWADVARQFKTIPFVHATVYAKSLTSAHAVQFEIWMGEGGKVRLRYGRQVLFADKKGMKKTYDIIRRSESTPHEEPLHVIDLLKSTDSFSLESVIQTLTGNMDDLRPVPNRVEGVSDDISIFELMGEDSNESIRIWALRESLLPVQLVQKNITSGDSIEIFFSYMNQQPETFFDPKRFEEILQDRSNSAFQILNTF